LARIKARFDLIGCFVRNSRFYTQWGPNDRATFDIAALLDVRQNQAARKINSEVLPTTGADSPAADGSIFLITDSRSTGLELPTQSALHVSSSFCA